MTREINGRIVMRVSDDGTRCAAECPHCRLTQHPSAALGRSSAYRCAAFGGRLDGRSRADACIAAERAAASVPSWQPIETAPRDGTRIVAWVDGQNWRRCEVILWWRSSPSSEPRWHRDAERAFAVSGTPTYWMPLPEAPGVSASAQSGHLDGGARALDASEALREARVQGMREGLSITKGHACAYADGSEIAGDEVEIDYEDAEECVDAAIEAVRKGER